MILAGIDEAGYGPVLGPLVVGCCAFQVDAPAGDELPCLWSRLRRSVGRTRDRKGSKLHVNDSKQVYSPATGLRDLERSVLAISTAQCGPCESLDGFVARVAADALQDLAEHRWYASHAGERFPLEQEGASIRVIANALKAEMQRTGTSCIHLAARIACERRLNRLLDQTRNKSSVLFSLAAIHLDQLLRQFGDQQLVVFCDRQGGREHYGHLLRLMFEEWGLEVLNESDGHSEYRLTRNAHAVRLIFREKAEAQCLPVAVASMLSKYLRESLMRRFNAWWQQHLPGIAPTAGYYTDGMRFLRDIDARRKEMGITDAELIRSR